MGILGMKTASNRDEIRKARHHWLIGMALMAAAFYLHDAYGDIERIPDVPPTAFSYMHLNEAKWPDSHVEFVFSPDFTDELISIVERSIALWAKHSNLTYSIGGVVEVPQDITGPPVRGSVYVEAIDPYDMYLERGLSAVGYTTLWANDHITGGRIRFREDLLCEGIALHEVGHALNLSHSDVPAVMKQGFSCRRDYLLFKDDIEGIASLYPTEANYEAQVLGFCEDGSVHLFLPRVRYEDYDLQFDGCLPLDSIDLLVDNQEGAI